MIEIHLLLKTIPYLFGMNWQLIFLLSGFGILMGILSVNGFTKKVEPFFWIVFGLFSAYVLSKNVSEKIFWHGFIVGILWGVFNGILQSTFLNIYLKNNPSYHKKYEKVKSRNYRLYVLLVGPMLGLVTGSVLGGLAWFFQKMF